MSVARPARVGIAAAVTLAATALAGPAAAHPAKAAPPKVGVKFTKWEVADVATGKGVETGKSFTARPAASGTIATCQNWHIPSILLEWTYTGKPKTYAIMNATFRSPGQKPATQMESADAGYSSVYGSFPVRYTPEQSTNYPSGTYSAVFTLKGKTVAATAVTIVRTRHC